MSAIYCTKCGHKNSGDARFCALCGTALSEVPDDATISLTVDDVDDDDAQPTLEGLHPGQAILVIKRGMNAGSTFLLDRDVVTTGRHPSSDIFLDDVTVSRRHAEILREDGRFVVKDAGSLNGTYLNRERVDVAELSSGDELQIGKFRLVFHAPSVKGTA